MTHLDSIPLLPVTVLSMSKRSNYVIGHSYASNLVCSRSSAVNEVCRVLGCIAYPGFHDIWAQAHVNMGIASCQVNAR
jgi:hypothetical protein